MGKKHRYKQKNQHGTEHNEPPTSHLEGEIGMVYTVRIEPNPEDKDRYADEKECRKNQVDAAKWLNVISGIGAGIAFLALIALIVNACLIAKSNRISKRASELAYRPYIGFEGIPFSFKERDSKGVETVAQSLNAKTIAMAFRADIKNFGPVPGTQFTGRWRIFVGGDEIEGRQLRDTPSTLYPGQVVSLKAQLTPEMCKSIFEGRHLIVEITTDYTGPTEHDNECEKEQFEPEANTFFNLGKCDH